ncbi:MAG: DUF4340 domain-containing protein [Gammaproteobacteria bacterium]|jgi:hypothetical protein|nr:DUF4340 domain-containing protein [Gammaproteobacteria bacterium]
MRIRWLLNLGLVVLVALLAVFALSKRNADGDRVLFTAIDPVNIKTVRLQYGDNEPIVIGQQLDKWVLLAPEPARANQFKIRNLLRLAAAASERQFAVNTDSLDKYGLDKPVARLWLDDQVIHIGGRHPFKNSQYVLYKDAVHLISAHYFDSSAYSYVDLISPRLFADHRRPVMLELPQLRLQRNDGVWTIEPEDESLAADRINDFVEQWRNARALAVARYTGRPVVDRVRVSFAADEGVTIQARDQLALGILSYKPDFVLYREDENLEYRFTEDTGKRLLDINAE